MILLKGLVLELICMATPEVLWEITHKCNAKCIHCLSDAGSFRDEELTTEEAFRLCDQFKDVCKTVHLLGGEVFLRKDWKQIIERLRKNGLEFTIVSNAIAVNREKIKYLKDVGIYNLGLSLDGGLAETNDYIRGVPGLYNKVLETMDILDEENVPFGVISTFNKLNISQAGLMLGTMINSPAKTWQVQIASAHGRMTKELALNEIEFYILGLFVSTAKIKIPSTVLNIYTAHDLGHFSKIIPPHTNSEWEGCLAGKDTFGVCSNGDVQGCLCMMGASEYVLGNVKEKTLKEIYEAKDFCLWNNRDVKFKILQGFCKDCERGYQCLAGCSDTAHSLTGSVGENPLCYHKIEMKWKEKEPMNDFENIFKELTQGFVDSNGNIFLKSGNMLNNSLIEKLTLDPDQKKLLSLLANV